MALYDITFYKLDLHLERNSVYIAGHVTLAAKAKEKPVPVFAFELHPNFEIDSVVVNGWREQNIVREFSDVAVLLSNPIAPAQGISVTIYYDGFAPDAASAAIGNGFDTETEPEWNNAVTWSLSEPYAAYEWWPTKQVLTDKADSVHVFVTTSAENKVGSNGVLTQVVDLPGNLKRYEWKSSYPIAYYLVSVAVSNYEEYLLYAHPEGASTPVPILNYVYNGGALERYREELNQTADLLELFSELFTLYPFWREKYGHSMAPIGGGMEHQTMTTQSTFFYTLTAHELAHQWFGDLVTCGSWQDIWLNEGFASYAEYLALQPFNETLAQEWMRDAHLLALQRPFGSVRVIDTLNVNRLFDYRLTYKKAASVVHMLRFEVNNDELFFKALRNYLQLFAGGTAQTADLKEVFEETTGKDLDYFFDQWYRGEGYPLFSVEWNQEENRLLILNRQTTSGTTPFFATDLQYLIRTTTGTTTIRARHDEPLEELLVQVDGLVTGVEVDPLNWVLNQTLLSQQNPALEVPALGITFLYPNPATTSLKVENLNFSPTTAIIYNTTGKLVRRYQLNQTIDLDLDLSGLAAGYYVLQLSNGNLLYRSGFIKVDGG